MAHRRPSAAHPNDFSQFLLLLFSDLKLLLHVAAHEDHRTTSHSNSRAAHATTLRGAELSSLRGLGSRTWRRGTALAIFKLGKSRYRQHGAERHCDECGHSFVVLHLICSYRRIFRPGFFEGTSQFSFLVELRMPQGYLESVRIVQNSQIFIQSHGYQHSPAFFALHGERPSVGFDDAPANR